jgi:hypothetical protein
MKVYKQLVSSAPAHSILNAQAFHYRSSAQTDIRKTFARILREQAKAGVEIKGSGNVRQLKQKASDPSVEGHSLRTGTA